MSPRPSIVLVHGVQSSGSSWWRIAQDLADLGWDVHTPDLLGHGDRSRGDADLTLDAMARDLRTQVPGPVGVVVGHSLGALVALTLTGLDPSYSRLVILEDPPGLGNGLDPSKVADEVAAAVRAARDNPEAETRRLLEENPLWSQNDASRAVASRRMLDFAAVCRFLTSHRWDVRAMVDDCPVPVALLAATDRSALAEPDRSALFATLRQGWSTTITSGHSVHRDRPGLWVHHVLRLAQEAETGPTGASPD